MGIADEFNSYKTEVIPQGAGQVQINETERAFFAGAFAALMLQSKGQAELDLVEECLAFINKASQNHGQ